jgi:hypothetical protein
VNATRYLALMFSSLLPSLASPQTAECVSQYLTERKADNSRVVAPVGAEDFVGRVSKSIGLSRQVTLVPCDFINKALAWPGDPSSSIVGEFIIYNPDWVREVLGKDQLQAVALFGHELGHFLNGDFLPGRMKLPQAQRESDADRFAGCAVARSHGNFQALEDLLSRLRPETAGQYPSRKQSIASAREGYEVCSSGGTLRPAVQMPAIAASSIEVKVTGTGNAGAGLMMGGNITVGRPAGAPVLSAAPITRSVTPSVAASSISATASGTGNAAVGVMTGGSISVGAPAASASTRSSGAR